MFSSLVTWVSLPHDSSSRIDRAKSTRVSECEFLNYVLHVGQKEWDEMGWFEASLHPNPFPKPSMKLLHPFQTLFSFLSLRCFCVREHSRNRMHQKCL